MYKHQDSFGYLKIRLLTHKQSLLLILTDMPSPTSEKLHARLRLLEQKIAEIEVTNSLVWAELARVGSNAEHIVRKDWENREIQVCGEANSDPLSSSTCSEDTHGNQRERFAGDPSHKLRVVAPDDDEINNLVDRWLSIQKAGLEDRPEQSIRNDEWPKDAWWCYACDSLADDGEPGSHFCWTKACEGAEPQIAGCRPLKVYCQYCCKGTARMPDLRAHFKKIVYCQTLRKRLNDKWNRRHSYNDMTD